jgi:F-type H+-transporting ATPase subunit b
LAHEAKAVLDSWVRYEGQVKARQQQELARSIIAKIEKDLESPKTLDEILRQSVKDVESKLHRLLAMESIVLIIACRDCG